MELGNGLLRNRKMTFACNRMYSCVARIDSYVTRISLEFNTSVKSFNLLATQQLLACLVMNAIRVNSKWSLHLTDV